MDVKASQCFWPAPVKRCKSAPPSTHLNKVRMSKVSFYLGRAGEPPAKAPPPLPSCHRRFNQVSSDARRAFPIVFGCTGAPLSDVNGNPVALTVDFIHSVEEVETALRYHLWNYIVRITSPSYVLPSDRLLTLCAVQGITEISVVLLPCNGRCVI